MPGNMVLRARREEILSEKINFKKIKKLKNTVPNKKKLIITRARNWSVRS
jgi:hypothetical protein